MVRLLQAGARRCLAAAVLAALALSASPAAANPIDDCFERIAVAAHAAMAHHPVAHRRPRPHLVRHAGPRPHSRRPHRLAVAHHHPPGYSHARYILKPIACGTHPAQTLMSPIPGAPVPETPQMLLTELAPPPPPAAPAAPVEQGGMPVIVEEAPLPGGPAEILPIFVSGPGGPSPGPVPVGVVPGVPGGPGTTVGVPEPATWGLMLAGFLALGGALRHRRGRGRTTLA